jgi:cob(I)alamin adenosyltransferase
VSTGGYSIAAPLLSIATKIGDEGETSLMHGRRLPKTDGRVDAYGCVDELNSALGLARSWDA